MVINMRKRTNKHKSVTRIKVYHAGQIGGNVTVVKTSKARIMIDFGSAFSSSKFGNVKYDFKKHPVDGVFFTHHHFDHVGRFDEIPLDTVIYMSEVTKDVIGIRAPKRYDRNFFRFRVLSPNESISIKDITVTAILSDHSAFGAYMYLIETPDKVILHTGDFRLHGYNGYRVIGRIRKLCEKKNIKIDTLIMEGTRILDVPMFSPSVESMEKKLTRIFKHHRFAYVYVSEFDFESVVAFYQAAKKNDMQFFMDEESRDTIRAFVKFGRRYDYRYDIKNIEIGMPERNSDAYKHGFVCVVKDKDEYLENMCSFRKFKPIFIFSERLDYIIKQLSNYKKDMGEFVHKARLFTSKFYYIHTSGHADRKTLLMFAKIMSPKRIIPIHTKHLFVFNLLNRISRK